MQRSGRSQTSTLFGAAPKRSHLVLMVAFFFLLGCVSLHYTEGGIWLWALAGLGALLAFVLRRGGMRCGAGIAVVCFALGALHAHAAYDVPMPEPAAYEISGYVYGGSTPRSDTSLSFVLGDVLLNGEPVSGKAYCTLHYEEEAPELFDGAKIVLEGSVYHPSVKAGEPRMDFRLWMRQHGYAFGVSAYDAVAVLNDPSSAPVKDAAHRVRQVFDAAFERTMGENGRIAMALLFGQKGGLSTEEYAAFQELGIAHVMSVSGLHVGLVGGFVMLAMDRFRIRRRTQLFLLSVFLIDYCALTGFSAASVRAAVMLVLASLARLLLRQGDRVTTLAAAMLVVLVIDPLSALSAGFILSFGAVASIILFSRPVHEMLDRLWPEIAVDLTRRDLRSAAAWFQRELKSLVTVSVTAQLGVLLPTMRFFQQLPLYGVFINLLIVPLVSSVLVPSYLITLAASLFPWIGQLAGSISSALTDLLLWLVGLLSRLPCASIRTAAPPAAVCIGLAAAGVMLSRRMPGRTRQKILAAVLTAAVSLGAWAAQRPAEVRYIQLSVGQEDSALLLDGRSTVVIDAGSDASAVIDYLMYENRSIDALILTHLHMDHAGGVTALLESGIGIRHIYLPVRAAEQVLDEKALAVYDLLMAQDIPVTVLASGDELRYNKTDIRVLWPERGTVRSGHDANDYPLTLAIGLDGYTILQASDLTGLYEQYAAVPADVLKVSHHGSADSTCADFLEHVSPAYAIVSASGGNPWLPSPATLQRLAQHGVTCLRTDEYGDITLTVEDGQLLITPYHERTD